MMTNNQNAVLTQHNSQGYLRLCLCGLFLMLLLPLSAKKIDDGIEFFVQVHTDKEHVKLGDSCTITYLLYSSVPFQQISCDTEFRMKHAQIRQVRFRPENTVQRVMMNGRRYYRMFWSQHVVIDKYNKSQHTKIKFYGTQNVQDSPKKVVHSNVP